MKDTNHIHNRMHPSGTRLFAWVAAAWVLTLAGSAPSLAGETLGDRLREELQKNYPDAQIELGDSIRWISASVPTKIQRVQLLEVSPRGEAHFFIQGDDKTGEGWIGFTAGIIAYVANRRILPGEKLSTSLFSMRRIELTQASVHDLKGLLVTDKMSPDGLESRQTILEGQALTTPAVEKIPDVRRGESVRIHLIAGDLVLITQGHAEQPSYLNQSLKVTANQTKRVLEGKLIANGVVEVKL